MTIQLGKIIDNEKGLCNINCCKGYEQYYLDKGYEYLDIEISDVDGMAYLAEKCPHKSNDQKVLELKVSKHTENAEKVKQARYNREFTLILQSKECVFDTSEETQRDLQTAGLVTSSGAIYPNWVTNNNVTIDLTAEDVQLIFQQFFGIVSPLYTIFKSYETAIDKAKTIKQLEKIVIKY